MLYFSFGLEMTVANFVSNCPIDCSYAKLWWYLQSGTLTNCHEALKKQRVLLTVEQVRASSLERWKARDRMMPTREPEHPQENQSMLGVVCPVEEAVC